MPTTRDRAHRFWRRLAGCGPIVLLAILGGPTLAAAQPPEFQVLHRFAEIPSSVGSALVEGSNGALYGVASAGGDFGRGAILRFDRHPDGSLTFTTLHSFTVAEGRSYHRLTHAEDGQLYGVTFNTDTRVGALFSVDGAGAYARLHEFNDPAIPGSPLVEGIDGNIYGLTSNGSLFRVSPAGAFTTIADLPDAPSGGGDLIRGHDGSIYAALSAGIYKIGLDGSATLIAPVPNGTALIEASDGNLYGTAYLSAWTTCCPGFVFRVTPAGSATLVHFFTKTAPYNLVEGQDGLLYGTTAGVGATGATVFRIARSGLAFETLRAFSEAEGYSADGLMRASDGALYGSTSAGGLTKRGVVYRLLPDRTFTVLQYFVDSTPLWLFGSLTKGTDGYLYGTSCRGGLLNRGSVFRTSLAGDVTLIHSFVYVDGECPLAGLVLAPDGNFYGTTNGGGVFGYGSIFRISPGGSFTVMHSFNGADGRYPRVGLSVGSNGAMYGTTATSFTPPSSYGGGTVYRINTGGAFALLHTFETGFAQLGGVVEGVDGNVYGSANDSGPFRIGPGSTFTNLAPGVPLNIGSILRANDGAMYAAGGDHILRLTVPGNVTSFTFPVPGALADGPIQGIDGNFYGTSVSTCFGLCASGALYSMTADGTFTILYTLNGDDGAFPVGHMVQANDGAFYGATLSNGSGADGPGVLFRLRLP